ncbi:MAG: flippase [Candidatus Atribacteria bacterium]|nr:MAG: flippase [Candidatus Atribacteria bacterium]
MNIVQRIAKNTGALFVANIGGHVLSLFYMMYTGRYLGPSNFGILTFALAFTGIFGVLTDFGLRPLIVREVARDKSLASKYIANISGMKIILVTITFGLIALTINLLGYPEQTIKVVYLVGLSVIFGAFTTMFYSIFQAYERMEYQSLGQILNSALMLGGVIFAMKFKLSVVEFAALYFLVSIFGLAYSFTILRIKFSNQPLAWSPRKIEVDWGFWKSTIKEALPFGLAITFVMIFYWIDSVMLSLMKGNTVVGWYNAAYRMVLFLLFIPNSFIAAIYPVMSKFYKTSQDSLRLSLEKSFKYLTIIGIPIGVGTTLLAKRIILLIFRTEYMNSIFPLQILVWSSVFIFMSQPIGNLFNSLNMQSIVTKITGINVGVNVILNLILIPKYSLIGASIATVITELVSLILCIIWSFKIGYPILSKKVTILMSKILIASMVMGLFVIYFNHLVLFILLPLAGLLYFAGLYIIRGIDKEDIDLVRRCVRRS